MTRRNYIQIIGAAASLSALGAPGKAADRKPYNVLIIHTDEHNFRTLGCYRRVLPEKEALMWGDAVVETLYIDSIANRGMVADSFYCASPVCSPSRASFVSGLYPMDTDVINNDIPIRAQVETFAEALHGAGYSTGYAGKWHLGGTKAAMEKRMAELTGKKVNSYYDCPELYTGWIAPERGMGFTDNRFMFDFGHYKKIVSDPSSNPRVFKANDLGDEKTYTTDWLADRTMDFITEHRNEPFCFMVSIPDPHDADLVREPYYSMYKNMKFKAPYTVEVDPAAAPAWAKPNDRKRANDAAYFGMVKCIDDNVGRMLQKLDELGLTERTIVVFTSDHGDMRGEHGRQNKGVPYEASVKIPFVIAAPGLIPSGSRTGLALSTVDFKPTLLSLLGVQAAKPSQGRDASAILRGEPVPEGWNDLVFSRSPGVQATTSWLMAVGGSYKLIASPVSPVWLIDLKKDPAELTNLAGNPELKPVLNRMAGALLDYAVMHNDPNFTENLRNALKTAAKK